MTVRFLTGGDEGSFAPLRFERCVPFSGHSCEGVAPDRVVAQPSFVRMRLVRRPARVPQIRNRPRAAVLCRPWLATTSKGQVVTGSFADMAALVADGSIRIIELHAVPRSMSTALGRALNESGATSVFINEPFNMRNGDVNVAAEHVVRAVEPLLASACQPIIVLSKNMARFLTEPVFKAWADVCSSLVWCIRDPRLQISSLVTRTANDVFFGIGSDRLKQGDLLPPHLATVTKVLQSSELSTDFSKTGWRAIGKHFTDCAGRCPSFVADGSLFSRMPDQFLRYLCSRLGLEFRDRMIDGWEKPFVNVDGLYDPEHDDAADAWVKQAATSRGVEATATRPLEESSLPDALREHLLTEALPTYEILMRAFCAQDDLAQYGFSAESPPAALNAVGQAEDV